MKKLFCILSVLAIVSPVWADDEPDLTIYQTSAASANYVRGAYDALTSAKQDKLTSTNVTTTGSGPVVTGVSASNGAVSVTTGEITVPGATPSGSAPTGRYFIWVQ